MKHYSILFSFFLFILSCKSDKENTTNIKTAEKLTASQKIAQTYGIENWKNVNSISFTFNVKKDSSIFKRSWQWFPKTNRVVLKSKNDTLRYNRNQIDSTVVNADKAFINDKFWLLAPFNLVWDSGTSISEPVTETAPISKKMLNKITVTYPKKGGYTPGDAYDFYYNNNYIIKEWIYRKANAKTPSMMTTWENNTYYNDILITLSHKKTDDNWELFFTNVSIN